MSHNEELLRARIQRIRIRIFLGIALVILITAPALTIYIEVRQRRYRKVLDREAIAAETRGDLDEAQRLSVRLLELRPGNFDATARFARILAQRATTPETRQKAKFLLKSVLDQVPGRRVERRLFIDLAMKQEEYLEAIQSLLLLSAEVSDTETAELEDLLAQCYEKTKKGDSAAEHYGKAITSAPDRIETYRRFADFLRRDGISSQNADELMDRMVQSNLSSPKALLERGRYRSAYALAGSKEDIVAARLLAPSDPETLIAVSALVGQDWSKADRSVLRDGLEAAFKKHPEDARLAIALAVQQFQLDQAEEAITTLRRGLEKSPDAVQLRWTLADSLIDLNRPGEAVPAIDALRKAKVRAALTDFLDARVLMNEEKWAEASRTFEKIRPSLKEIEGFQSQLQRLYRYCADCAEKLNDTEGSETAVRRMLALSPKSVSDRERLAEILASTGRIPEALALYKLLLADSSRYHLEIARLLIVQNSNLSPNRKRWGEVEKELKEAARALPDSPLVGLQSASYLILSGQLAAANKTLDQLKTMHPDRPEVWIALTELASVEGKESEILPLLDEAEKRLGDRLPFRLNRIRYWVRRGGEEAAAALAKIEAGTDSLSATEQRTFLTVLAIGYIRIGKDLDSDRIWDRFAKLFPKDLLGYLASFDLALRKNDAEAMERAIVAIRGVEGEKGPWGDHSVIRRLLNKSKNGDVEALDQARELAAGVATGRPHWMPINLLLAQIEDLSGKRSRAVPHYLKAIEQGESDPLVVRRTVELLYSARRFDEAAGLIDKLPDDMLARGELRRLKEDLLLKTQGSMAALASTKKALANGSADYQDYLWLGRLCWTAGKKEEVEPAIQNAIRLGKEKPEPWLQLVEFLLATDQKEKAEKTVREAEEALPREKHLLDHAILEERVGRTKAADELYQLALAAGPDDPKTLQTVAEHELRENRSQAAEPVLRTLLGSKTSTFEATSWARRTLAVVLSEGGDNLRCEEALGLLDDVEKTISDATPEVVRETHRARGVVLARQPGRPQRKEAVRLLAETVRQPEALPSDLLLLATLHEEDKNWPAAKEMLSKLMSTQGQNAEFLAAFARGLLRRGDAAAARPLYDRLKKLDPVSIATVEVESRLLKAENKNDQAGAVLVDFAKGKDHATVFKAAGLLEDIGVMDRAESLYRTAASEDAIPDDRLNVAMFLARRNRTEEALSICEAERSGNNPESVARICMYILATADSTEPQRERLAGWLEQMVAKATRPAELWLRLATVRDMQGRYKEAEALYRRSIETNPRSPIALNNLAWILTFQEGRESEALNLINRAFVISGPLTDLLDTRAVIYLALREQDKALLDIAKVVSGSPTPSRLFHLCQVQMATSDLRSAKETFERAKAAGLSAKGLHALERPSYQRLAVELAPK